MAYRDRDLLVSHAPVYPSYSRYQQQQQQSAYSTYIPRRTFNHQSNRLTTVRHSPPQNLRIECTAEERHYLDNSATHINKSYFRPIRSKMEEENKPVQFRSEIIVHNNPEYDVHIKTLRIALHYHDDSPNDAMAAHQSMSYPSDDNRSNTMTTSSSQTFRKRSPPPPPSRPTSSQLPPISPNKHRRSLGSTKSQTQTLLHQWIDDICANEELMSNDDIVFFIKNGEFFARI